MLSAQLLMFFRRKSQREDTRFLRDFYIYIYQRIIYALWTTELLTGPLWLRVLFLYVRVLSLGLGSHGISRGKNVRKNLFFLRLVPDDHCGDDRIISLSTAKFKSHNIIVYGDIEVRVCARVLCYFDVGEIVWQMVFGLFSSRRSRRRTLAGQKDIRIARGTVPSVNVIRYWRRRPHAQIDSHGKPKSYRIIFRTCHCGPRRLFV